MFAVSFASPKKIPTDGVDFLNDRSRQRHALDPVVGGGKENTMNQLSCSCITQKARAPVSNVIDQFFNQTKLLMIRESFRCKWNA